MVELKSRWAANEQGNPDERGKIETAVQIVRCSRVPRSGWINDISYKLNVHWGQCRVMTTSTTTTS